MTYKKMCKGPHYTVQQYTSTSFLMILKTEQVANAQISLTQC